MLSNYKSIFNPFYLLANTTFNISGAAMAFIGAGAFSSFLGSQAQQRAAEQQAAVAQQGLQFEMASRRAALGLAAPTFDELAQIQSLLENQATTISNNFRALEQQQGILDAVDPAIKEAGSQALQLLQGKEAAVLDPVRQARERQRQRLTDDLSNRLGGGFATSSAGIVAMSEFDAQTDMLLAQAQQSTLNTLLQTSVAARPDPIRDASIANASNLQAIAAPLTAQGNIQNRQISALQGSPVNFGQVAQTAGADQIGAQQGFQTLGQVFGGVGQATQIESTLAGLQTQSSFGPASTGAQTSQGSTFGSVFGGSRNPALAPRPIS